MAKFKKPTQAKTAARRKVYKAIKKKGMSHHAALHGALRKIK